MIAFFAVLLFVIPAGRPDDGFLMGWRAAVRLPWGVLLLFGGALALAADVSDNGIVFDSGLLRIPEMIRAGFWLTVPGIALISLLAYPAVALLLD